MARFMIRKEDPWVGLDETDVRGWQVRDRDGQVLGRVEDVYINANARRIDSVVTASGREIPADHFRMGEQVLLIDEPIGASRRQPRIDDGDVVRSSAPTKPAPGSFDERFYTHYNEVYRQQGQYTFENLLPAYHFGRIQALQPKFYGRPFERSEEDLQALFGLHVPQGSYRAMHDAIKFGYGLGARVRSDLDTHELEDREEDSAQSRLDTRQTRPVTEEPGAEQAATISSAMAIPGAQSDQAQMADKDGKRRS